MQAAPTTTTTPTCASLSTLPSACRPTPSFPAGDTRARIPTCPRSSPRRASRGSGLRRVRCFFSLDAHPLLLTGFHTCMCACTNKHTTHCTRVSTISVSSLLCASDRTLIACVRSQILQNATYTIIISTMFFQSTDSHSLVKQDYCGEKYRGPCCTRTRIAGLLLM